MPEYLYDGWPVHIFNSDPWEGIFIFIHATDMDAEMAVKQCKCTYAFDLYFDMVKIVNLTLYALLLYINKISNIFYFCYVLILY